jgi:molybdopterin-guanine dinucleotide biosynthesis protein B
MLPIIAFVGHSNTGKTTLIERLIPVLKAQGLRVGVVKHRRGDFEIDVAGKDSYRYREAGAEISVIAGPRRVALVRETDRELALEEILSGYLHGVDLVILEGRKDEKVPKIEVVRSDEKGKLLCAGDPNLLAVVADVPIDAPVPLFRRDDLGGLAAFVVSQTFAASGDKRGY